VRLQELHHSMENQTNPQSICPAFKRVLPGFPPEEGIVEAVIQVRLAMA